MRLIWIGLISFGLINIFVKLFFVVQESSFDMDMLDKKDYVNIKFKWVNEDMGKEIDFVNIVKGYKIEDKYVIFEDLDFEVVDVIKIKIIDIQSFVEEKEIVSFYYEQLYYLEFDKGVMNVYVLF